MKWILIALGGFCLLAIALLGAVPYLVDLPQIQAYIAQSAGQALGRQVKFSALSLSVLPLPAVILKDLQVAEDPRFGSEPFLSVGEGRFRLRLGSLFSGHVEFAELTLERPRVELIQDGSGRWNVTSVGAGGPASSMPTGRWGLVAALPAISRIRVVDGALFYQASHGSRSATRYRVEGVRLTVQGLGRGTPIGIEGEAQLTPGAVLVKLDGAVSPPPGGAGLMAAPIAADISLEAKDLGALAGSVLGPSPALAGPVKGKLALTGTLGRPTLTGRFDSARLVLTERRPGCPPAETRRLTLESVRFPLTYDPPLLTSRPLSLTLSGGSVSLALSMAWEPTPLLSLKEITIRGLPLGPVLLDYLCQKYAVSGSLDLTGELSAHPGDPWRTLAGQGQIRIGAGKVAGPAALALVEEVVRMAGAFSAINLDLSSSLFSSLLEFQFITAAYRIADGRLTTQDFVYTSKRMTVAAAGEYGLADGRMNFDLTLRHERGQIKGKVTGTAASPSVRVLPGPTLRTEPERFPDRLKRFLEGLRQ